MRAVALALLATGCAVGGSSSMVGRWGARRVIDSTACVQVQAPGTPPGATPPTASADDPCEREIAIGRDIPARSFSSLVFVFAATGYVQQRGGEAGTGHGALFDGFFEYVRGRGRFGLGARLGGELATGFDRKLYFMMPVSVVGHYGGLWGSVFVGAGYSPIALQQQYFGEGDMETVLPAEYHFNSVHAFVGTRFWLRRTLERGLSFSPELRFQTFDDRTLTSLTGNIGLHF